MTARETYTLAIITTWANTNDHDFQYHTSLPLTGHKHFLHHGINLRLFKDFSISIQTHPDVTSASFADTMLLYKGYRVHAMGYKWGSRRWDTPEELFDYLDALREKLLNYTVISDDLIRLSNGKIIDVNNSDGDDES